MYTFRDYLYLLATINYHLYQNNSIKLDNYNINIKAKNTKYMLDNIYGYEAIEYYIEITNNHNELLYNTKIYKLSTNLEYVSSLNNNELIDYIFKIEPHTNNKLYKSTKYNKIKELQTKHPFIAKEVGILSTKNPDLKIMKEIYINTKILLNKLNKKINKHL